MACIYIPRVGTSGMLKGISDGEQTMLFNGNGVYIETVPFSYGQHFEKATFVSILSTKLKPNVEVFIESSGLQPLVLEISDNDHMRLIMNMNTKIKNILFSCLIEREVDNLPGTQFIYVLPSTTTYEELQGVLLNDGK